MIPQDIVKSILAAIPNGQFFTVIFEKKGDGAMRRMVCQKGVRKHLKGGPRRAPNPNLQGVYEQNVENYRCFDTRRVCYIKARGVETKTTGGYVHLMEEVLNQGV